MADRSGLCHDRIMSRELRRVAKGWHHPMYRFSHQRFNVFGAQVRDPDGYVRSEIRFRPLHQAAPGQVAVMLAEYSAECADDGEACSRTLADWMPDWPKDALMHWQIYETVSEGTPVSPVFGTKEELLAWMTQPIDRASIYNAGADRQCMQGMQQDAAEKWLGVDRTGDDVKYKIECGWWLHFSITGNGLPSEFEVEAASPEQARKIGEEQARAMFEKWQGASLCHQCADEGELGDEPQLEIFVEEVKT